MLARFNDFDRTLALFDTLFRGYEPPAQSWRRLAARETKDALLVTLDVPGMNEEDILVEIHDDVLTIRGAKKSESKVEEHLVRAAGLKFEKSFSLPYPVDTETAEATVKDGVLEISLPKVPEAKPRTIAVKPAKALPKAEAAEPAKQ